MWRGVLEYFEAHIVGLTATPGKQTFGFFKQNLVSEYTYPESVADGVNVDFDVYRIRTEISEQGSRIEAGTIVPKVNRQTRAQRLEALDDDLDYGAGQLDRSVTATDQIRTVLEAFRDRLFTEIFPGRSTLPKTLIFAKDDNHAEEIVTQVREIFGKGNDFAAKITYSARDPKGQLQAFRTSPTLRIAVTVDMIATGTDVKPLECVFFMRDVRSAQYFEQMKGRGARTISPADFQAVTPDAETKTRFVIVDAVGVTEHPFVEPPLNRDKSVPLKKLLQKAAMLTLTEDEAATLASRLAKLELDLTDDERHELDDVAGQPVRDIVRTLVDAVEPATTTPAIWTSGAITLGTRPRLSHRPRPEFPVCVTGWSNRRFRWCSPCGHLPRNSMSTTTSGMSRYRRRELSGNSWTSAESSGTICSIAPNHRGSSSCSPVSMAARRPRWACTCTTASPTAPVSSSCCALHTRVSVPACRRL